ncbi:hypothetical protein [Streptomyces marincola]|nr:hypothetical protein [Streptomyces marincola]
MADQFRDKAHEFQERAKDAMGNKDGSKRGEGKKGRAGEQGSVTDRAKQTGRKAMDEAKQRRDQAGGEGRGRD